MCGVSVQEKANAYVFVGVWWQISNEREMEKKGGVVCHIQPMSGGHNSLFRRIETKRVYDLFAAYKSIVIRHWNALHSHKRYYEHFGIRATSI